MPVLFGVIAVLFILNGFLMFPNVESAMQQQVVAIYLVGGCLLGALASLAGRVGRIIQYLEKRQPPAARTTFQPTAPEAKEATSGNDVRHMPVCPNCGRELPPGQTLCHCGYNLKR